MAVFLCFLSSVKSHSCWCWCSWMIFGNVNSSLVILKHYFLTIQFQGRNRWWYHYDCSSGDIGMDSKSERFHFLIKKKLKARHYQKWTKGRLPSSHPHGHNSLCYSIHRNRKQSTEHSSMLRLVFGLIASNAHETQEEESYQ